MKKMNVNLFNNTKLSKPLFFPTEFPGRLRSMV